MRKVSLFFLAGLLAGATSVAFGAMSPTLLAIGVGPLFFVALFVTIALTDSWLRLGYGVGRYVVAAFLSTGAYVLALFSFSIAAGYAPQVLGVRPSTDIVEFHGDIWVGLVVGVLIASICLELVAYVLTNKWSNLVLLTLTIAGIISILLTYVVNLRFHNYWSFLGVLLPSGEGLFCGLVGMQFIRTSEGKELMR
jgi:hypothetical protein